MTEKKLRLYLAAPTDVESLAAAFEALTGKKLSPAGRARLREVVDDGKDDEDLTTR